MHASRSRGINVVVFDEHAGSRGVLGFGLTARGYACSFADSEDAAVAAVKSGRPQAVIFDWCTRSGMRSELGSTMRDAARAIGRELLVIVTSSRDHPQTLGEDVDAYFAKPLDMRELIAFLEQRVAAPT